MSEPEVGYSQWAENWNRLVAERDRLAERVDILLKAIEQHHSRYSEALAQVAMLREALLMDCSSCGGHGSFPSDEDGPSYTCAMCNGSGRFPVSKEAEKALAATADAGKWLEQHDDAVRAEESGRCIGIIEYSVNDAHDRNKAVARIRSGHEQHTNRARGKK